jgi:redox-sensitive bicupin YhaK (pirin superfamily)
MITLRRARDRFHSDFGWLDSWHTFSFGDHYDPDHEGFRRLRVINDDTVAAGGGFPTHGHRDMDIVSYVIDGALGHKDSMGNGSVIKPGDVQRMSAGTGVRHSEMNAHDQATHFLQIWIIPDAQGNAPGYEQKTFPDVEKRDRLALVASGMKRALPADIPQQPVRLFSDTDVYASRLSPNARVQLPLRKGRHAWVHVVTGAASVSAGTATHALTAGDGAAISDESALTLTGAGDGGEVLVFDLD